MSGWQITGPCPTNWRGTRVPVSQNIKPRRTYSGSDKSEKIRQIWENRTRGQIRQMFTRPETTLCSHVNKIIIHLITFWHCYFHYGHQGLFSFCIIQHKVGVKTNTWFSFITCKLSRINCLWWGFARFFCSMSSLVLLACWVLYLVLWCLKGILYGFIKCIGNSTILLYWRVHNLFWPVLTILFWHACVSLGFFGILYLCSHYPILCSSLHLFVFVFMICVGGVGLFDDPVSTRVETRRDQLFAAKTELEFKRSCCLASLSPCPSDRDFDFPQR